MPKTRKPKKINIRLWCFIEDDDGNSFTVSIRSTEPEPIEELKKLRSGNVFIGVQDLPLVKTKGYVHVLPEHVLNRRALSGHKGKFVKTSKGWCCICS